MFDSLHSLGCEFIYHASILPQSLARFGKNAYGSLFYGNMIEKSIDSHVTRPYQNLDHIIKTSSWIGMSAKLIIDQRKKARTDSLESRMQ